MQDTNLNISDASLQQKWADRVVAELLAGGVVGFVLSPGSRNTPLALALARGCPDRTVIHQEERGAAFFAMGAARACGKPWAVVCTSGSAAANWMPAAVEAYMSRLPLILLSADRPETLHHRGANQTIEQSGMLSPFTRLSWNLSPPLSPQDIEQQIRTLHTALAAAMGSRPGPVHLNLPFREPLVASDLPEFIPVPAKAVDWYIPPIQPDARTLNKALEWIHAPESKLAIVGGLRNHIQAQAVRRLLIQLGWPVYADITSGLRLDPLNGLAVPYADLLARHWTKHLDKPDHILWIGDSLVHRVFPEWLANTVKGGTLITEHEEGQDPYGFVSNRIVSDVSLFCDALAALLPEPHPITSEIFNRERITTDRILDAYPPDTSSTLNALEPLIARWTLKTASRFNVKVFLGNSMPIRWAGLYGPYPGTATPVLANRGASGIDGAIATVAGLSQGYSDPRPIIAILGDLTVFHDLPSLALVSSQKLPLILVVLNNGGGGIFHHLPQARCCSDLLNPWFTAGPAIRDFSYAARMFGLDYLAPDSQADYLVALESLLKAETLKPTLIELHFDPEKSVETHARLTEYCLQALTR